MYIRRDEKWTDGWINLYMEELTDELNNIFLYIWIDGLMADWMDGWRVEWLDVCMDGLID